MSDFDPTTNRVQYGMLTYQERAAINNAGHGWEAYHSHIGWIDASRTDRDPGVVYRAKPVAPMTDFRRGMMQAAYIADAEGWGAVADHIRAAASVATR